MSTPRNPGETFLGASVVDDPFALLGLPRRPADDQTVLAALGARMDGIAKHPRSQTPEANELRLALHAAAAQLLDAQVQELLLQDRADEPQASSPQPPHPRPKPSPILAAVGLSHDVLMVVAANGGWNNRAMRRLAQLAHARGIPSAEIPAAVIAVLGGFAPDAASTTAVNLPNDRPQSRAGSLSRTQTTTIARKKQNGTLIPIVVTMVTILAFLLVWVRLTQPKPTVTPTPTPSAANTGQQPIEPLVESIDEPEPSADQSPLSAEQASGLILELASRGHPLTDGELKEFESAHSALAERWIDLKQDQVAAVHNAIVELLYIHVRSPEQAQRLLASIAKAYRPGGTDRASIASTVWAVGTLTRLSQERNLPNAIDSAIVGRLAGVLGERVRNAAKTFREGAIAACETEAKALAASNQSAKVWMDWLHVLGATVGDDQGRREQEVLNALETLFVIGKDPTTSRASYEAIEVLAAELDLKPKSRTADVVIGWFADTRISAADLAAVMRPLVQQSQLDGIDQSLVPSGSATEPQRMAIRQKLESVLQGKNEGQDWPGAPWLKLTESELAKPVPNSAAGHIARVVTMSRLSSAAHAILWGDEQTSEFIVANLHDDTSRILATKSSPVSALGGDGSMDWAARYLNARQNIPIRESLLNELTRGKHVLGPVAAELVVKEAILGSPATIRRQAQEVARLYRSSPAIVNAVLEYLPRAPRVRSISDLIETIARTRLPAVDNPAWAYRARKATVERLLELITGIGQGEIVDELVSLLAQSYDARLTGRVGASIGDAQSLEHSSQNLYKAWHDRADDQISDLHLRSELEGLDHRLVGRLTLAKGSLERFAAYQVSTAEAAALLIRAEQPAIATQVESVIESLNQRRRSASDVLEQLVASEESMVKLWQLRLEGSQP